MIKCNLKRYYSNTSYLHTIYICSNKGQKINERTSFNTIIALQVQPFKLGFFTKINNWIQAVAFCLHIYNVFPFDSNKTLTKYLQHGIIGSLVRDGIVVYMSITNTSVIIIQHYILLTFYNRTLSENCTIKVKWLDFN